MAILQFLFNLITGSLGVIFNLAGTVLGGVGGAVGGLFGTIFGGFF